MSPRLPTSADPRAGPRAGRRAGPRAGRRAALLVGSMVAVVVALVATPAVACDPPYIVDEETGELDQEAWDAGVEECARWSAEMDGAGVAELALPVAAGAGILALGLWARPRRSSATADSAGTGDPAGGEPHVGDPAWSSDLVPRLWWALALVGLLLMASPLLAALS